MLSERRGTLQSDDGALLARYFADRDEAAFALLVERYTPLVYSAAARRVGDPHLAQDVAQAVFFILARKRARISMDRPLSAWLLSTVRFTAANALKIDARRRRHEGAAAMQRTTAGACSADPSEVIIWQDIAKHLDDAVLRLPCTDRVVVLLRYFEDRPIGEIALALNCSEQAVRQRLSRALEKLRQRLDRTSGGMLAEFSAEGVASMLLTHAVGPAPPALAVWAASGSISSAAGAVTK